MEFNPLPDLLNTGFTVIKISLFYGGEHENMQIPDFFDKITSRWQFLVSTKSGMTTYENTSSTG